MIIAWSLLEFMEHMKQGEILLRHWQGFSVMNNQICHHISFLSRLFISLMHFWPEISFFFLNHSQTSSFLAVVWISFVHYAFFGLFNREVPFFWRDPISCFNSSFFHKSHFYWCEIKNILLMSRCKFVWIVTCCDAFYSKNMWKITEYYFTDGSPKVIKNMLKVKIFIPPISGRRKIIFAKRSIIKKFIVQNRIRTTLNLVTVP